MDDTVKTAKLFKYRGSQAVRLPKDCTFEGSEVYIRRVGDMVILYPKPDPWERFIQSLGMFTEDFMNERLQGEQEEREPF